MNALHPTQLHLADLCALKPLARHLVFPVQVNPQSHLSGHYLAKIKGQGMEFDDVRLYQAGDDVRNIDWRVTARTGTAHTKQFRQEKEHPVWLCCDFTGAMQFGSQCQLKSVLAGHLLALLCWHAKSRRDKVGGIVFSNAQSHLIAPESSESAIHTLLNHACSLQNAQSPTLEGMANTLKNKLSRLASSANPGSFICVISDWSQRNEGVLKLLHQLNAQHNLMLYHIVDPLEQSNNKAKPTNLMITDGQHLQYQNFPLKKEHSQSVHAFLNQVTQNLVSFTTAQPLTEQVYVKRRPLYA
jgi:uncharacterized protein (DUF58 family)